MFPLESFDQPEEQHPERIACVANEVQGPDESREKLDAIESLAEYVKEIGPAPSMEVQARELSEYFRETPELQYENWKDLDADQRLEALENLEMEAAAVAHRLPMAVRLEAMGDTTMGYQHAGELVLNEKVVQSNDFDDYVQSLNTLLHEGRHAYQSFNLGLAKLGIPPVEQNTEYVNAWSVNLETLGYDDPSDFWWDGMGYERYYTQPIEVDARAFADEGIRQMGLA